jgi:hydroxymethylbilane synthase
MALGPPVARSDPRRPVSETILRVGTRRSPLARAQAGAVVAALAARAPGCRAVAVPLSTAGDRSRATEGPLDFTDAIDAAILAGDLDLGVHSAKDLPAAMRPGIRIGAVPRREDPRDCLVLRGPGALTRLPPGTRIGTSSCRRRAQLRRARPDIEIVDLRGNVDTRLSRVRSGELDGVLLAVAGLARLERTAEIAERLPTTSFLPAPGQGALAVTYRASDRALGRLLRTVDHPMSRNAVVAERAFSSAIGGDCRVPLAAQATVRGGVLTLRAEVLDLTGDRSWSGRLAGPAGTARSVGRRLAEVARRAGVQEWMAGGPGQ